MSESFLQVKEKREESATLHSQPSPVRKVWDSVRGRADAPDGHENPLNDVARRLLDVNHWLVPIGTWSMSLIAIGVLATALLGVRLQWTVGWPDIVPFKLIGGFEQEAHPGSIDVHLAISLLLICLLPQLLAEATARMLPRASAPPKVALAPSVTTADESQFEQAQQIWIFEKVRMSRSFGRAGVQARIWGFLCTLTLAACAMASTPFVFDQHQTRIQYALAASAAATTCFILTFGQFLVRAAEHDANTRMFARASRDLLRSIIVAVVTLAFLNQAQQSALGAAVIGLAAGLVGPAALTSLKGRATALLGLKSSAVEKSADLSLIDGMSEDDVARLAEEGINSIQLLAFTPTPRIYLNTPFSLQSICDWQNQALLALHAGAATFQKLRAFSVRTPAHAQQCCESIEHGGDDDALKEALGMSVPEATLMGQALKASAVASRIRVYQQAGVSFDGLSSKDSSGIVKSVPAPTTPSFPMPLAK